MAIEYSDDYVATQYRSPRLLPLKTMIKLFPLAEGLRRYERRFLKPPQIDPAAIPPCDISDALEHAAPHFQTHGWAFANQVIDADFHRFLCTHWPRRRYFTAPFDVHKAYDKGFPWVDRNPADGRWHQLLAADARARRDQSYPPFMDEHPHIKVLFDFLRSETFEARLTAFSGKPQPLCFNRFQLTTSYPGTLVAPHRDSQQAVSNWVSLVFHVAGSGGEHSGGLSILEDNQFKKITFEVKDLTNTCLLFDPSAPFYHGFKPIAFGKYRYMLQAEYASQD